MPHRGRLNVLTNLLDYPPEHIIRKIKGYNDMPKEFTSAIDDVISHIAVTKKKKFIGAGIYLLFLFNALLLLIN